jgi:ammonia channel protein AmtB
MKNALLPLRFIAYFLLLLNAPLAFAAEPPKLDAANTAWMLTASVLVLFMTLPGLGVGGALGTLLTGIFVSATFGGIGYPEQVTMGQQFLTQLIGVLSTAIWSGVMTWVLVKLVDAVVGMRVAAEEETEGLDTVLHNEKGYTL